MNPLEDLKTLDERPPALKKFGLFVGSAFSLISLFFLPQLWAIVALTAGIILITLGATHPLTLRTAHRVWMGGAFLLGYIISHILLTGIFYLLICPIALAAHCTGQDFLALKWRRDNKTYWIPRPKSQKTSTDYKRQF